MQENETRLCYYSLYNTARKSHRNIFSRNQLTIVTFLAGYSQDKSVFGGPENENFSNRVVEGNFLKTPTLTVAVWCVVSLR